MLATKRMTDAQKKRPWFQYCLSTLLVLMFAAASLFGLNAHRHYIIEDMRAVEQVGWPVVAYEREFSHLPERLFPKAESRRLRRHEATEIFGCPALSCNRTLCFPGVIGRAICALHCFRRDYWRRIAVCDRCPPRMAHPPRGTQAVTALPLSAASLCNIATRAYHSAIPPLRSPRRRRRKNVLCSANETAVYECATA